MNKLMVPLAGAMALAAGGVAHAQDKLSRCGQWSPAQFAGIVAESKGFTTRKTSDITILPGGPNVAPEQVIAGGGADIIVVPGGGAPHRP